MFDTDLYQQVLGLSAPWRMADVTLDVESAQIYVHVEHSVPMIGETPALSLLE